VPLVKLSSDLDELTLPTEVINAWPIPNEESLNADFLNEPLPFKPLIDDAFPLVKYVVILTDARVRVELNAPVQQPRWLIDAVSVVISVALEQLHVPLDGVWLRQSSQPQGALLQVFNFIKPSSHGVSALHQQGISTSKHV